MSGCTLVLGGARSGKSAHAQKMAERNHGPLAYIATAQAFDKEMTERIARHRADRDERWSTIEAPLHLPDAIRAADGNYAAVLVDCLTLWLSNLMLGEHDIAGRVNDLLSAMNACSTPLFVVSNEVGLGIVPENALARAFRDQAGRLNQAVAGACNEVVLMAAGIALTIKPQ